MRRTTFALAVALSFILVVPAAVSAWSLPGAWADPGALWSTFHSWLPSGWNVMKAGQHMDPNGEPTEAAPESRTIMDPAGAPGPEAEAGMHMDPNGVSGD